MSQEYTYIAFDVEPDHSEKKPSIWHKLLLKFVPEANPDFEDKISLVRTWLAEVDNSSLLPEREIGIGDNGDVLMIMPWRNNYGYWTDNNLKLNDVHTHFDVKTITEDSFKEQWERFENSHLP